MTVEFVIMCMQMSRKINISIIIYTLIWDIRHVNHSSLFLIDTLGLNASNKACGMHKMFITCRYMSRQSCEQHCPYINTS